MVLNKMVQILKAKALELNNVLGIVLPSTLSGTDFPEIIWNCCILCKHMTLSIFFNLKTFMGILRFVI